MVRRSNGRRFDLSKRIITTSSKPREHARTRYATFKHQTDHDGVRRVRTQDIPRLENDYTPAELFNIFEEFDELRTAHHMDDGATLFCSFQTIISSCRKAAKLWRAETDSVRSRSVANFDLAYNAFKANILSRLNYYDQLEYLRTLRKPGPMSVEDFERELQTLNDYAIQFPDAPDDAEGLTNDEMKRLFYHAMPTSWQRAYTYAGYRYNTSTFDQLLKFMEIQEELHPYQPRGLDTDESSHASGNDESSHASDNEYAANDTPEESDAANDHDDQQYAEHFSFEGNVH